MRTLSVLAILLLCSCSSYETHFNQQGGRTSVLDEQGSEKLHIAAEADILNFKVECRAQRGLLEWTLQDPNGTVMEQGSCDGSMGTTMEWASPTPGNWTLSWNTEQFVGWYGLDLKAEG